MGVGKGIAISLKGGALPADAKKEWSIAIGNNASAENGYDIAIGGHSHAKSKDTRGAEGELLEGAAIAIGKETKAIGQGTIAIGRKTLAEGEDGSAYGSQANAHGARSTALGYVASASGNDSLAGGALAESRGEGSVALGKDAQATGDYANAIGSSARATEWATAVGPGTQANGVASAAYGDGSVADGEKAIAMGSHATAKNESTIAIGNGAKVGATNGNVAATNGIAIGTKSESKDQQAIAVGKQAIAAGNNSIALGNETTTTGDEGVAIGNTASASNQSVAFGSKAKATAQKGYSSAFGNESVADQADASAIGNTAKALAENATSVGAHSTVDTGATYGSALGRSANVSAANGTALGSSSSVTAADGTAVGTGATVSTAGGVALGQGSKSTRAALDGGSITISSAGNVISSNHITDKDITDKDNSTVNDVYAPVKLIKLINDKSILERVKNTIKGTAGAVSLGNNTTTRQLTNLAPGSADYDAVNVAQLKAVVGTIKHYNVTSKDGDITINPDTTDPNKTVWDLKINPKYKIKYFSVNSTGDTNEDNKGATGDNAIAIGKNASSTGSNAVSLGLGAKALGNNNTAIGAGAQAKDVRTTAVGYNATAEAASAVGIGYEAHATQSRSLAIGQDATASANNAIALGSSGQQSGNDRPNKTTASAEHSVAIGSGAVANIANGIALGSQSKTTAASGQTGFDASQDADGARVNTYKDLTNNKKNVRTSTLAGLSIGDTDKTRQINHLAAGTADDDAVNVAQLKSVNLAFKGDNNTKGDVRLHDQRLSVVGATGSFITTKANDNKLEISTTQGTFSTTADGKSSPTTAGLATTTAVASAINNSGWEVRAKGTKVGLVNPGDKVDFTNADNSIEIESSAEANGLSTIKFKAVTAKINTEKKHPVEITINNGITTKKIDKTKQATPTGKFVVPTGDDTNKYALATAYDVADKVNQTGWNLYTNGGAPALINPGDYVNFKSGNATNANVVTEASEGATISYDVNVDNTTIKIDPNGNKLTANTGDVDSVTNTEGNSKKGQVTIHKDSLEPSKTDSGKLATVDTVVKAVNNAKWFAKADNNGGEIADNAKTNDADDADGQAMGAGDKLTLKAGKNLRVKRDGANFTFATDNDVTFNKVTSNEFVVNPNGKFTVGSGATINMGDNIIHGVATGVADTDAVNVAQLKSTERHITPATYAYNDADKSVTLTYTDGNGNLVKNTNAKIDLSGLASKIKDYSFKTNATGSNLVGTVIDTTVASGKSVNFAASDNLTLKQDVKDGNVTYTYGLKNQVVVGEKGTPGADGKPGKDGVDGSIGVNGKDGSAVAINGKDGSIGLNGKDGKNGLTIKGQDGKVGVDGKDGETRLVYVEKADPTKPGGSDKTHELATLDDGMKYGGDIGEVANVKLNKQVDIKGGVTDKTKLSDNNIGVISIPNAMTGGTELTVKLAKELKGLTSAEFKGGDDNAVTNITNSGITIKPANSNDDSKTVSLTNTGLNNGGNKITHVAEGKDDTDAVNVKQLKDFKTEVNGYGWNLSVNNGENSSKITKDTTVDLNNDDGNIKIAKNGSNVTLSLGPDVGLGKAGKDGKDGSLAVRGKDGASVEISGKDGSIGLTGPKGKDGTPGASATITVEKGTTTVNDDRDGGKQVNRIVYTDKDKDGNDIKREVATLDDGLKFKGDSKEVINRKLGSQVNITGGADSTKLTENNIGVVYDKVTNGLKVKLSKDVNLGDNGTITIGDTVVNKDGLTINGGPSVTKGGVNAGNQSVTNVKDGAEDNDAVNVKQLKTAKTEVEAGDHIDVTSRVGANGQTIYKVSAKGINDTSAAVKGGSNHVEVTKAANTHKDGSTTVTDYTVDLSKETKEDIKKGVDAHTEVTTKGLTFNADHGTTGVKKLGSKVAVNGDGKNITTTADENGVKVSMKDDIKVNSVTAKEVKVGDVNINENGINAGGKRITNVAPGKDGTDAVNVNQLKYVAGNISNQINNVDKGLRAGIAGALASGGLYHVTTPGKSMVSVGAGTYRGQNALAVGYSRLSDNGKVGVKFTVNSNSQGHSGASASVGYQW